MPTSLPSKKIAIVDAPEVPELDARFVYNFFVPDEMVNDSGIVKAEFIKGRTPINFDTELLDSVNFNRFVPRFNKITWSPRLLGNGRQSLSKVSIASNLDKIYNETSFVIDEYTSVFFQDNQKDQKLSYFVRRVMDEIRKGEQSDEDESLLDVTKFINKNTSADVKGSFIGTSLSNLSDQGQTFVDKDGQEVIADGLLKEVSRVGLRSQINNKILHKLLKTTSENVLNVFDDELEPFLATAKQIQEKAISEVPSSIMEGRDYDFEIRDYVDIEPIDTNGFEPVADVVGYLINKTEITDLGETIQHPPIVIESPFVNSTADLKIKYGSRYNYTIQTVVLFKVQAEDADENDLIALSFLVSSKPSEIRTVLCEENVPPPPPADFNVAWDYDKNVPYLTWNFPVNTQRDIKYFQVFRRRDIDEAFELVKMYDFDDSVELRVLNETPEERLVEVLSSPRNIWYDESFDRDNDNYIYSVCSVDAHGLSSGYAMQYDVGFNRLTNRLEKEVISNSGAPKAYPNMFLLTDTFVDSIRDSGHKKLRVIFNPEYLKVVDSSGNDLKVLKGEEGDKYRLQMINVDLQEQQVFDISLLDIRKTIDKTTDNEDA